MTVIAYLATPIDADILRNLLIGLDATVTVNDDGILVIETNDQNVEPIDKIIKIDMESWRGETHTAIYQPSVTSATDVRATFEYTYPGFKDYDSPEDAVYDATHDDPCDCDDCRSVPIPTETPEVLESDADIPTEPPVGSVIRCEGCGNVYVHKPHGWVDADNRAKDLAWDELQRPLCGPLRVIYRPGGER